LGEIDMAYTDTVRSKTIRELLAMKRSLELSADDVGCFSANDPELLEAVEAELRKRNSQTTDRYWSCKCEGFHLHSTDQDDCPRCGARKGDSPRPLVVEVEEEIRNLAETIGRLKEDDVHALLDTALSPETKARLKWPPHG
jgi:hypothetical protein